VAEMNALGRWMVNFSSRRRGRRIVRALGGHVSLSAGPRILELGAGRGGLSEQLWLRYRPRSLSVTDFDPKQVEAARAFLRARFGELPAGMEVREADALSLPFGESSFEAVFAIGMLHHVDDRPSDYRRRPDALREVRRVLAPSGLFVYSDFSRVPDLRRSLRELGFEVVFSKPGWFGRELAVCRRAG